MPSGTSPTTSGFPADVGPSDPLSGARADPPFGDGWSSWGGYDVETEEQFFDFTRDRSARFDDLCDQLGRDPKTVRHSLFASLP